MQRILGALLFLLATVSLPAQAGLLRYDVSHEGSRNFGTFGYMIFDQDLGFSGNLFPSIVDWRFEFDGFVIDTTNTQASAFSEFVIDVAGNVIFDGISGAGPFTNPCFSPDGCLDFDVRPVPAKPYVYFTQSISIIPTVGGLAFETPVSSEIGPGTTTYTASVVTIPTPGPIYLLSLGVFILLLRKGKWHAACT